MLRVGKVLSPLVLRLLRRAAGGLLLGASTAAGAEPDHTGDEYVLTLHGETHAQLFRRAPLPGPAGALVASESTLPIQQTVLIRADDLDTAFDRDSVDIELGAWAAVVPIGARADRPGDGDVQTAWISYRRGPVSLRLGRQHVAGGAARYSRFDGADLEGNLGSGFTAVAYGGTTVLPRWNARPGYHVLGGDAIDLLDEPGALSRPGRSGHWLAGGRVEWLYGGYAANVSFHEQHEMTGLSRRTAGADGRAELGADTRAGGHVLFELDAGRASDARLWVGAVPADTLDVEGELRHVEPALLLSRQSVLSVFSTEGYDEAGVLASWRALPRLTVDGAAYVYLYGEGRPGGRSEIGGRVTAGRERRTVVRLNHTRLQGPGGGYHALRAALSLPLTWTLTGTLDSYAYLYDELIRGYRTSTLHVATVSHSVRRGIDAMAFASAARSPYAALDAQIGLRLSMDFDLTRRMRAP